MDWPGEKLVIRLWETVADKGIGSLLKPWQIRREGRAHIDVRREELLLLAQAESDAEAIRSGHAQLLPGDEPGELTVSSIAPIGSSSLRDTPMPPPVAQIAVAAVVAEAVRQEVNIGRALIQAEAELADDPQAPPPTRPDDDWLFRWRDAASAVSNDEMQQLWGRVLAGEIKAPGQFSLRTLEFLRNISQDDAKAVEKLFKVTLLHIIYRDDALLKPRGIDFDFLLAMQDLGVVSGVESVGLQMIIKTSQAGSFTHLLLGYDHALLVTHPDDTKELRIPVYQITTIGKQVLKLSLTGADKSLLQAVGEEICKQGFNVALARYSRVDDNSVRYFESVPICTPVMAQTTNP